MNKKKVFKIFTLSSLSIMFVIGGFFGYGYFFTSESPQSSEKTAKASSITKLARINEYRNFEIEYSNMGDGDTIKQGLFGIYIGDKMDVDLNSFRDNFNGRSNCISPSLVKTKAVDKIRWGYALTYRPKSAQDGETCSGSNTKADFDLKAGGVETGKITFRAKPRSDVGLKNGDIMDPFMDGDQGILGRFEYIGKEVGSVNDKLLKREVNVTIEITDQATVSSSSSSASLTTLTSESFQSAACTPQKVNPGEKIVCEYVLKPGIKYNNLTQVYKASVESASRETVCQNSDTKIICSQVPTDNASYGIKTVKLKRESDLEIVNSQANVEILNTNLEKVESGRLYFVGDDNKEPVWNDDLNYNTNYREGQLYKTGDVKIVFDQLKDKSGNLIDQGDCVFQLMPLTKTTIVKTYASKSVNGKCEAVFSKNDQNTYNYYHVLASVQKGDLQVHNSNVLVLFVGSAVETEGSVEFN